MVWLNRYNATSKYVLVKYLARVDYRETFFLDFGIALFTLW